MISRIQGELVARDLDRVEVRTAGGVSYELAIPLSVFESLPSIGDSVSLYTRLIVRDDEWLLYGFASTFERRVFTRLLTATGVGPALALGILSTLNAERVVRAIHEHDIAALQRVPRVGRKKAERLILELADKLGDLGGEEAAGGGQPVGRGHAEDAVRGLMSLGYAQAEAERAVRAALDADGKGLGAAELIRLALTKVGARA